LIATFLFFEKKYFYLLNTQVAMIASLFVVVGSFLGYRKVVTEKSKHYVEMDNRDELDKIDDKYELFSENTYKQNLNAKEILEEEKKRFKNPKESVKNFIMTSGGFLSVYRVLAYIFLITSVLILIDKKLFNPIAYLIGLSIVPVSALLSSIFRGILKR